MTTLAEGGVQPGIPSTRRVSQRHEIDWEGTADINIDENEEEQASKRLCLWPTEMISIQNCWAKVREILNGGDLGDCILKIVEVRQTENQKRFDIWVNRRRWPEVLAVLRRAKHQHRWWVRAHKHYMERLRESRMGVPQRTPGGHRKVGSLKIATWNINSIASKRQELELYLSRSGVRLLALQETWRDVGQWPLCLKEFQVFEALAEPRTPRHANANGIVDRKSHNGLALVVHRSMVAFEYGEPSPYMIGIRVMFGSLEWNVLNIYIPPRRGGVSRREALRDIRRRVNSIYAGDLGARLMILGDWNMSPEHLSRLLRRWGQPLLINACSGSRNTYRGPQKWSSIDHMVVSPEAQPLTSKSRVNRTWDLSDHWPLECKIQAIFPEGATKMTVETRISLDKSKFAEKKEHIRSNTMWDALAVDVDAENMALWFETTVAEVATATEIVRDKVGAKKEKPGYRLSKGAKQAIAQRRKAHCEWAKREGPRQMGPLWMRYVHYKRKATTLIRRCAQSSWIRHVAKGAEHIYDDDLGGFWKWAKQLTHRGKSGTIDYGPMFSEAGELVYDPQDKLKLWKRYYETLLGDLTGHSRNEQFWADRFPGPECLELPAINGPIVWGEVNRALAKLKSGKSSGCDGVPPEFFKLAFEPDPDIEPSSSMGRAILRVLRVLWNEGRIPDQWNEAWVVSILKKGDPKKMTNYRGISLLVVIVKILTMVILQRISSALEERAWFVPQQAGFRVREECAGHICALYEIISRRVLAEKTCYVAFVDFEKAYDSVPIEGVLRKAFLAGVQGKCLDFLRALYANAGVRVRTGFGLSEVIKVSRGLRQGCNLSPLLFDIYINDILNGCELLGVTVIGLNNHSREAGLLFADDLVLMSNTRTSLQAALELVQSWADTNEMKFGVGKCGIMGFGTGANERLQRDPTRFRLHGAPVPIMDSYTYLGVPFQSPIDLKAVADTRAEKGRKVLNTMRGVLGCSKIPISLRVKIVSAILIPVLTYGGELWGMLEQRCKAPQSVLSETLRVLWRLSPRNTLTSAATLGMEVGIPSIYSMVCAKRARAYQKFVELRTTIELLIRCPPTHLRHQTWVSGTKMWILRLCPLAFTMGPEAASKKVKETLWERFNQKGGKSLETYRNLAMEQTRSYLRLGERYPQLARGFHWLGRLRTRSFWTAERFAQIKWISEEYRSKCPFCQVVNGRGEDIAHLLMECAAWNETRDRYLSGWTMEMGATWFNLLGGSKQDCGLSLENILDLWCPKIRTFHPDVDLQMGVPNGDVREYTTPGCVRVSQYLQHVIPQRIARLRPLLEAPRADAANTGMAVLVTGGDMVEMDDRAHLDQGLPQGQQTLEGASGIV
jgi:exonuclease III